MKDKLAPQCGNADGRLWLTIVQNFMPIGIHFGIHAGVKS